MGMKRYKRAVAVTGEYQKDGETKKSYMTIGTLMQYDDGGFALKLDAVPTNFNGWVSFYDFDEDRKQNYQQGTQQAKQAAAPADDFESEIPF
jgi:hypothetical protein